MVFNVTSLKTLPSLAIPTLGWKQVNIKMRCGLFIIKLLLNDQNEFGVLDMIEWKMKYTELIDNVYVLKEMIDV